MGCGSSRGRKSRPNSPCASQEADGDSVGIDISNKSNFNNVNDLKILKNKTGGLKTFKALALTHTKIVQEVRLFTVIESNAKTLTTKSALMTCILNLNKSEQFFRFLSNLGKLIWDFLELPKSSLKSTICSIRPQI